MHALINGGTGFVGSHALDSLQRAGQIVHLLASDPSWEPNVLGPLGLKTDKIETGDMAIPTSIGDGRNLTGTVDVDEALEVVGGAVHFSIDSVACTSSITVRLPCLDQVIGPESPFAKPMSNYNAQKASVNRFVQDDGTPVTMLVVNWVHGSYRPHLDESFDSLLGSLPAGVVAPPAGQRIGRRHSSAGGRAGPDRSATRW